MVRMNDSLEEWFNDALSLTNRAASSLCQWANIELEIAVMSINELLEVRLEFCMCIIGGQLILTGSRDVWVELTAQWNTQTSPSRFPCPLSCCLQEHKKRRGDAWIIYLTQTTTTAPSYSEQSRNNEDGGLALWELWTESVSHCRPPELQLIEVRYPPRISTIKNNKQFFSSWLKSLVGLYLYKNNTISYFSCLHWFVFWASANFFHLWYTSPA